MTSLRTSPLSRDLNEEKVKREFLGRVSITCDVTEAGEIMEL